MSHAIHRSRASQAGFSLLEFAMVCAILITLMASIFGTIGDVTARSSAEQVKTELTQEAREFVDEFQRDLHQSGYPNCRMIATNPTTITNNCDFTNTAVRTNTAVALGLVYVSNTEVVFEGDVDGDGDVDSVWYRVVDQNGNYPPSTTCPCTIQRSQNPKTAADWTGQTTTWSQELQGIVNTGTVSGTSAYTAGSGLTISGTTAWGASNNSYYASLATVKDYPVFTAYDNNGAVISLPLDITTSAGQNLSSGIPAIKSVRIMINVLADATTGVDQRSRTRPMNTIVGNARIVNCGGQPCD